MLRGTALVRRARCSTEKQRYAPRLVSADLDVVVCATEDFSVCLKREGLPLLVLQRLAAQEEMLVSTPAVAWMHLGTVAIPIPSLAA